MKLSRYDNKRVRIDCIDGKIYEGICYYDSPDYCFHEFGREEEALEILYILFYKSDIKKITILKEFTEAYGEIEIMIADDMDLLEQTLECEENEHIYRLLLCLEERKLNNEIIALLKNTIKYNTDKKIIKKAKEIIKKYEGGNK